MTEQFSDPMQIITTARQAINERDIAYGDAFSAYKASAPTHAEALVQMVRRQADPESVAAYSIAVNHFIDTRRILDDAQIDRMVGATTLLQLLELLTHEITVSQDIRDRIAHLERQQATRKLRESERSQ